MKFLQRLFAQPVSLNLEVQRDWEVFTRSYAAPRRDFAAVASLPEPLVEKAMLGVTTYLWQDKNTGEFLKQEILGNDRDELAEICEKVDITGQMQLIRLDGKSYGIARVPEQTNVPLK